MCDFFILISKLHFSWILDEYSMNYVQFEKALTVGNAENVHSTFWSAAVFSILCIKTAHLHICANFLRLIETPKLLSQGILMFVY